jgi:hypothetical protein
MRFLFLLALGLVASCKPAAPPVRSHLLNIDSLIDAQIKNIPVVNIEKTIHVNDSTFYYKVINQELKKEMVAFQELNQANRSIYRDSYLMTVESDKQSNLTVKAWTATKDVPIKSLKLFYLDKLDRLKRIEAELTTSDLYSQSSKNLSLDFSILGDTVRLETYSISGMQQYFWGAPQYFSIAATIRR